MSLALLFPKGLFYMNPKPVADLLSIAERELKALEIVIDNPNFPDEVFGYIAQQSVEKALKAWISSVGVDFPYTHDIAALLRILEKNKRNIEPYWDLAELTTFTTQSRYLYVFKNTELDRLAVFMKISDLIAQVRTAISEVC